MTVRILSNRARKALRAVHRGKYLPLLLLLLLSQAPVTGMDQEEAAARADIFLYILIQVSDQDLANNVRLP
jgi:hypothetical protein